MISWIILLWIIIFIISIAVLIKGSDWFIESAERVGLYFGISPFIIGVTIVAMGTSLPELISSIISVLSGAPEIVIGTVLGSNIANIFFIIGITAVFAKKLKVDYPILNVDLPFLVGTAVFLIITLVDWTFKGNGVFTVGEAVISLFILIMYLVYNTRVKRKEKVDVEKVEKRKTLKEFLPKEIGILIGAGLLIYLGGKFTVDSVIFLSRELLIGKDIIAASAVAFGSSVPELVVSLNAARKGKTEIAIGNVIGSNIFNSLGVMGIPALLGAIAIPTSAIMLTLPVMFLATIMYFFIAQDNEITSFEGWLLIALYALFLGKLFNIV